MEAQELSQHEVPESSLDEAINDIAGRKVHEESKQQCRKARRLLDKIRAAAEESGGKLPDYVAEASSEMLSRKLLDSRLDWTKELRERNLLSGAEADKLSQDLHVAMRTSSPQAIAGWEAG